MGGLRCGRWFVLSWECVVSSLSVRSRQLLSWRVPGVLVGVAFAVLAVGCSSTTGQSGTGGSVHAATPIPSPSFSCAPDGERRACTAEELEHAEEFLAVKAQYEGFTKVLDQWLMAGAPVEETPDFGVYADSDFSDDMAALGGTYREHGVRSDRAIVADRILLKSGSHDEVVILVCTDARDMKVLSTETGEEYGFGYRTATETTARPFESTWKLVSEREVEWQPCA